MLLTDAGPQTSDQALSPYTLAHVFDSLGNGSHRILALTQVSEKEGTDLKLRLTPVTKPKVTA